MPEQRVIIMTSGTSLFEDKGANKPFPVRKDGNPFCTPKKRYPVKIALRGRDIEDIERHVEQLYCEEKPELFGIPLACPLHIRQLNGDKDARPSDPGADPFPAELSSLLIDYFDYAEPCVLQPKDGPPPENERDLLYLLHSDTEEGKNAAIWLKCLFSKEPINKYAAVQELCPIKGVRPMDVEAFSRDGIANLAKTIFEIHNRHQDKEIVLDITGGFKGMLAPAEALVHCLPNVIVRYLFESSSRHIFIPPLPLSFDVLAYFEHRGALRALDAAGKGDNLEAIRRSLPRSLSGLYIFQGGAYERHPLGEKITSLIEEMKSNQTLPSPYGTARTFAGLIEDVDMARYFEKLVLMRQHHWHGDVIPETVPHDRGHAQRLLEMGFQVLMPLKDANREYFDEVLPPWAVLILLCSLWMHDVGHTGGKIKPDWDETRNLLLNPYPSLVRDLHHYLGYQRILRNEKDEYFISEEVQTSGGDKVRRVNGTALSEAVAVSYLFHRKKADWDGITDFTKVQPCWSWVRKDHMKPLSAHLSWDDESLRIMKRVIALQRLIDAFDVMNERVGALELRDHKRRRLAEEIEMEWDTIHNLHMELSNIVGLLPDDWEGSPWGPEPLASLMMDYWGSPKDGSDIPKAFDKLSKKELDQKDDIWSGKIESLLLDQLRKAIESNKILFQEYLSHIYKLLFKPIQMAHYAKHAAVESTVVLPANPGLMESAKWGIDSTAHFKVVLTYGQEAGVSSREDWLDNYVTPLFSDMKKELTPPVKDALLGMQLDLATLRAEFPGKGWAYEDSIL